MVWLRLRDVVRGTGFLLAICLGGIAPIQVADAKPGQGSAILWEARSEAGTVFLLGSVHFARADLYPLNPVIESAYRRSDQLVVELDPLTSQDPESQAEILARAMYEGGENLQLKLSAETFKDAREALAQSGLAIEMFIKLKPWFVALTLTTFELARMGFEPALGIDLHFIQRARAEGRPVLELERLEDQIGLFTGLTEREQEAFLRYTIADLSTLGAQMDTLFSAWKTGDAQALERLLSRAVSGQRELQDLYRKMTDDRNNGMLEKIEGYLESSGRYFVIVGAGHLVGPQGLVARLRKAGYSVEQR